MNTRSVSAMPLLKRCLALGILLLTLAGYHLDAQAADRTFTLKISRDKKNPTRTGLVRPVGDAGKWTFRFELDPSLELVKPPQPVWTKTTQKANANQGEQDWGLWIEAKNVLPPAGPDPNNSWIAFSMPDQPGGTFSATVTAKARTKRGPGGVGGNAVAGPNDEFEFTATWTGEVSDVTVEFEPDLIRTGCALDENGDVDPNSPIGKVAVTATVTPKEATSNINIVPGKGEGITNRVSITNPIKNADTGKITFDLRGTSASKDRNGDSLIAAKKIDDGKVVGTAKVVVIVPKKVGEPFPQNLTPQATIVVGQNMGLNSFTSPAQYEEQNDGTVKLIPKTHYWLYTLYKHWQTIHVVDQFGLPLDSLYAGVEIEETHRINQTLSAQGTYQDPVSIFFSRPTDFIADSPDKAINDEIKRKWEAKEGANNQPVPLSSLPLADRDKEVSNFVVIAGHVTYIKRRLVITPGNPNANPPIPDRLQIEWIPVQETENDE